MKIRSEDGVSVTVATRASTVRTSQGRHTPRRDRDSEVGAEARQRQFFWGRGKPMKYQDSWHEAESSRFSASMQPWCKASRTTSLVAAECFRRWGFRRARGRQQSNGCRRTHRLTATKRAQYGAGGDADMSADRHIEIQTIDKAILCYKVFGQTSPFCHAFRPGRKTVYSLLFSFSFYALSATDYRL